MTNALQNHRGDSVGPVTPVLCLAGQNDVDAARCGRTLVGGLDRLAPWIFRQREIWPASHVAALPAWLPHVVEPASTRNSPPLAVSVQSSTIVEPERRGRHQSD
jgi:hypothetical protein